MNVVEPDDVAREINNLISGNPALRNQYWNVRNHLESDSRMEFEAAAEAHDAYQHRLDSLLQAMFLEYIGHVFAGKRFHGKSLTALMEKSVEEILVNRMRVAQCDLDEGAPRLLLPIRPPLADKIIEEEKGFFTKALQNALGRTIS